jgi:hypothetical protein
MNQSAGEHTEMNKGRRDAQAAARAAADMVATAQRIAKAVESFHEAADRLEEAARISGEATKDRLRALLDMRSAGLSINEISALTGLSPSRLQSLTRPD